MSDETSHDGKPPRSEKGAPKPANLYSRLLEGVCYPNVESMLAALRHIESEFNRITGDPSSLAVSQPKLVIEIHDRIEMLKDSFESSRIWTSRENAVFFNETLHRIEEDLLLLRPAPELSAEAEFVRSNIDLAELAPGVKDTLRKNVDRVLSALLKAVSQPQPMAEERMLLRISLNTINRGFETSYCNMYTMKLNVNWQTVFLLLSMSLLAVFYFWWKVYAIDTNIEVYVFAAVVGAFGGSLGSLLGEKQPNIGKGSYIVNLISNVFTRPIVGAATGLAIVILGKSELLFTITATASQLQNAKVGITVRDPFLAFQALAFVGGFSGEKLLRSSTDQIIGQLTALSSRNQGVKPATGTGKKTPDNIQWT